MREGYESFTALQWLLDSIMDDNQLQTSFSVTVIFLNETDMKQDLPDQHQELTLHVHRQLDDVSLTINNGKQKQQLL